VALGQLPRVGELVDERVGLTVEDALAVLDDGEADGSGSSALHSSAGSSCVQVRAMRQEIAVSGRSE
jgi:hypothetical protein